MTISESIKKKRQISSSTLEAEHLGLIRSEESIKLSVITQFFPPDYAATGQLIEELVRQLGQQGVDIEVFTGQPGYAFQTCKAPIVEHSGSVKIRRSRIRKRSLADSYFSTRG